MAEKPTDRPKLPTKALQNIADAEKLATKELQKAILPYSPRNPEFVYDPVEINAACWKVIDHLITFADAIFDAQAREYLSLYPEYVRRGDFLATEIGPEVIKRTKFQWTKWETEVDFAIQARWPPAYYSAYAAEANRPDSDDQKLLAHFIRRLEETVSGSVQLWQEQTKIANTTLVEAQRALESASEGESDKRNVSESHPQPQPTSGDAGAPGRNSDGALDRRAYVSLLQRIINVKNITLETWAADHKFGRTTVFDWKSAQLAGKSLKGKVSASISTAIQKAIEKDAKALGLWTRTDSD